MFFFDTVYSNTAVYKFIFWGVFLFAFLRALFFILPLFIRKKNTRKITNRFFPIFELVCWLFFFIWAIQFFLKSNHFYASLLFVLTILLMLIITWYAIRDFVAGIIFKTGAKYSQEETVKILDYTGKIVNTSFRTIELETEQGERVRIPYSKTIESVIVKSHPALMMKNYTFELKVKKDKLLSETIAEIKQTIIHLPWASIKKDTQITPKSVNDNYFVLDVTIYTLDKDFFYKIENQIRKKFEVKNKTSLKN